MHIGLNTLQGGYDRKAWMIPAELKDRFGLNSHDMVSLKFGSASTQAIIGIKGAGAAELSKDAVQALMIPPGITVQIRKTGNREFQLGPVIGILTFGRIITKRRLSCYQRQAVMNKSKGLLYVFSGQGINARERTIQGYYYDCVKSIWKKGVFPFPDAVIDRCYPSVKRYHRLIEKTIGQKIFNKKTCINKLEFYRTLNKDSFLKNYLPPTGLLDNSSNLKRFLNLYQKVFLKPVDSMKGKGIVLVEKKDEKLLCKYLKDGKKVSRPITSPGDISEVLKNAARRTKPYLIQQAIPLMKYKGEVFSFRTWAMKNGRGQWVMPGIYATVSVNSGYLTNVMAGAKLVTLNELYKFILPKLPVAKDEFLAQIEHLTLRTAALLDRQFGPLGELGIDIVIDSVGKPWLIEANGNPGKIPIFIQNENPAWRTLVYRLPLDYARFLAGFK